jgi:hypothetical protein
LEQRRLERRQKSASSAAAGPDVLRRLADLEQQVRGLAGTSVIGEAALERRERAARQAALTLKVQADEAMEELRQEQAKNTALEAEVKELRQQVRDMESRERAAERARTAYGEALTQLLGANDLDDL